MKSKDSKLKVFYKPVELEEDDYQDGLNGVFDFLFDKLLMTKELDEALLNGYKRSNLNA